MLAAPFPLRPPLRLNNAYCYVGPLFKGLLAPGFRTASLAFFNGLLDLRLYFRRYLPITSLRLVKRFNLPRLTPLTRSLLLRLRLKLRRRFIVFKGSERLTSRLRRL